MLYRLNADRSQNGSGLNSEILIRPPDQQSSDILSRYGIPTFKGVPPIIILSPDEQDKKQ